jgi:phenylacetate-CoA ligase
LSAATHIYRPEVETRELPAQRARDDPAWRRQLWYLFERSGFYRGKFRAAGFAEAASCGGLDGLALLPFTEKDEIRRSQAEAPPLGRHLAADPAALVRIYSTSGTTGDPCYMPVTSRDLANWVEISSHSYTAGGMRRGLRTVSTCNAGPFIPGAALDTITALGVCHIPVGTGNTARLIRALQLMRPEALLCTPSYAVHLAEQLAAEDIAADGLGLRRICVAGEPGGGEAQIHSRIESAFGAMLCEAMGTGDVSISLWGECDAQQLMHFSGGDHVHVELGPGEAAPPPVLAQAIEQAVRATLVASLRVTLVPFGSIGRSEYKTKLLDFGDAT